MKERNEEEKQVVTKSTGIPALDWMRAKFQQFSALTKKNANDNIWVLAVKLFFQAIMVLVLIALSPFALFAIMLSIAVAS